VYHGRGLRALERSFALILTGLWMLPACAHAYRPPAPQEPHASLDIKLSYHAWPGTLLEQSVTIDGDEVRDLPQPTPQAAGGVSKRSVRVRPGSIVCMVGATFFHNEVTTHAEAYETSEVAPCGNTTCTQLRPHTRLVNHAERVDDASCTQGVRVDAEAGKRYRLEFDFHADRECTLKRSALRASTSLPARAVRGGARPRP
jgi:hypothetical protein